MKDGLDGHFLRKKNKAVFEITQTIQHTGTLTRNKGKHNCGLAKK